MKIFSLNSINFNKPRTQNPQNSQSSYNDLPPLKLNTPLQKDTVSFSAKIPSITTPTVEDIINRVRGTDFLRHNILRIGEHDIPCPVCGNTMFPDSKYNKFEEAILNTTNSKELLNIIAEHKKYLHPVEKKIFSMMREDISRYPELTLHDMLKRRLPVAEKRIIFEQSKIFNRIEELSRNLPKESRAEVNDLINETYERILDPCERSRFSRQTFLDKLKSIFVPENIRKHYKGILPGWIYTNLQDKIIEEAIKLPTASNSVEAFIVKYSKKDYENSNPNQKIALRILSDSHITLEHIKAKSKRGETAPRNLSMECAGCNNRRKNSSIIEQITENPQMILNYPLYIRRLCDLHHLGVVEKFYIREQHQTYVEESFGILSADLSSIEGPTRIPKRRQNNDTTLTKAERRALRKSKIKEKQKKNTIRDKRR